jgi:hypothetical protein
MHPLTRDLAFLLFRRDRRVQLGRGVRECSPWLVGLGARFRGYGVWHGKSLGRDVRCEWWIIGLISAE